jgi:hypothetical protein
LVLPLPNFSLLGHREYNLFFNYNRIQDERWYGLRGRCLYQTLTEFLPECLELMGEDVGEKGTSQDSSFNQVLRIKAVHCLAFFILFYVGVEVTIGGLSPSEDHTNIIGLLPTAMV